jgi:hypothetical protein
MTLFSSSPFLCISREAVSVGVLKPLFELIHFRPKRVLEASQGLSSPVVRSHLPLSSWNNFGMLGNLWEIPLAAGYWEREGMSLLYVFRLFAGFS